MSERKHILFLDDDPNRAAIAYQRMPEEQRGWVIWCKTAEEAIITLQDYKETLTLVTLDHDLGGQQFVHSGREDCGMEVVRWLEKLAIDKDKFKSYLDIQFKVHTWNTSAGLKMNDRLYHIGLKTVYSPFGTGYGQIR